MNYFLWIRWKSGLKEAFGIDKESVDWLKTKCSEEEVMLKKVILINNNNFPLSISFEEAMAWTIVEKNTQ